MEALIKKIQKIQGELKAPKNQVNAFGRYKYRSCEDILEAIKPLLSQHGLALFMTDEIVQIGERYYVKATAQITDGKATVESSAYAREPQNKKGADESQITGAASSYSRKYCLSGMFCIDDTKDADATNDHGKANSGKHYLTDERLKVLWAVIAKLTDGFKDKDSLVDIYKELGVRDGKEIKAEKSPDTVQTWINKLNDRS